MSIIIINSHGFLTHFLKKIAKMTKIMYDHYSLRYKIKYFNLFIKMLNFKNNVFKNV